MMRERMINIWRMHGRKMAATSIGLLFLAFLGYEFGIFGREGSGGPRMFGRRQPAKIEEVPVLTARVTRADVPVTLDAIGTVQALNTIVVRAQVEGRLNEILFRDGQNVKKGDVLARIDARALQAQYDQALAKKAQDAAQLANAKLDLERYERLAQSNFGSRQQADTQRATVEQLEALQLLDQALVDNAKVMLDYATIIAPIDGRTGLRNVDAGNVVRASDPAGLVTITQMHPIGVLFSLPQQNLRAVNAAKARGAISVQALESDNRSVIETGEVEVIDNLVDAATGTVRIRAVFPNEATKIWPGQFVNIRLELDVERQALTVPSAAVQRGPNGPYVFVVGEDSKVALKNVTVARQNERVAVLTSGVEEHMRVVTSGFMLLNDGTWVKAADADAPQESAPAAAPNRDRRRTGGSGQSNR
jgi:multidrug efflux system membrane fusion protein